jgi:hypothetical protein
VTVSSSASNQRKIEFDNLQSERVYKPMFQAYAQSKLAGLIFSQEIATAVEGRRVAHSQHSRTSWIRGNKPAGGSSKAGFEDPDYNDEAFPVARRDAWGSASPVCRSRCRGSSWRLLRPGWYRGAERGIQLLCRCRKARWMKPLRSGFGWKLSASHM